jgi:hypothetical protein
MATSLLDWIIDLMRDGSAREAFNSNPQMSMASAGFTNVCGSDVRGVLVDEPTIREVAGASLPPQSEPDIKYIVNNFTVESPSVEAASTPGPDSTINGDGNTVDQTHADTTDDDHTDNSTATQSQADNIVPGDGSAGEDRISDSTITDVGQGITGDDNTSVVTLTDNLNDVHVLSDTIHDTLNGSPILTDDLNDSPILNGSPILNDLLDDSLNDSLDDLVHNLL